MSDLDKAKARLAAIGARAAGAKRGPWHLDGRDFDEFDNEVPAPYGLANEDESLWSSGGGEYAHPDLPTGEFIVHARDDVPDMRSVVAAAIALFEVKATLPKGKFGDEASDADRVAAMRIVANHMRRVGEAEKALREALIAFGEGPKRP